MYVRKKRAKHLLVSASVESKLTTVIFAGDFQGAEEKYVYALKECLAETRKKSTFFYFCDSPIMPTYGDPER